MDHLLHELQHKECTLALDKGRPLRMLRVAKVCLLPWLSAQMHD